MRLIKVALANVETTVGAVRANAERVIALGRRMAREDVTFGAFPEQVLGGYPPEDLVQWGGFVDAQRRALERFARETADLPAVYALGLVFDGGGFVFQNGRLLLEAPRFREGLATVVLDLDRTRRLRYPQPPGGSFFLPPAVERPRSPREELLDDLFEALALGAKDYFEKSGCFRRFGVALSGGRDSVLSLLVAWRAVELLHPESSGAELRSKVGEAIAAFYMPAQALFLQTSDMSERAVGYTTIGGDLEGGLSVIANVPKTLVVALLERLRARFGFEGIARALETVPGPELARSQAAEEELMPFEVLDACLHLYAAEKLSGEELASVLPDLFPSFEPERLRGWARKFVTLFTRSIYKWVQSPITLHVGSLDLERERALQLPVVERDEWSG